eukprot:2826309-Pyramimonas_sp.AAC.2
MIPASGRPTRPQQGPPPAFPRDLNIFLTRHVSHGLVLHIKTHLLRFPDPSRPLAQVPLQPYDPLQPICTPPLTPHDPPALAP